MIFGRGRLGVESLCGLTKRGAMPAILPACVLGLKRAEYTHERSPTLVPRKRRMSLLSLVPKFHCEFIFTYETNVYGTPFPSKMHEVSPHRSAEANFQIFTPISDFGAYATGPLPPDLALLLLCSSSRTTTPRLLGLHRFTPRADAHSFPLLIFHFIFIA